MSHLQEIFKKEAIIKGKLENVSTDELKDYFKLEGDDLFSGFAWLISMLSMGLWEGLFGNPYKMKQEYVENESTETSVATQDDIDKGDYQEGNKTVTLIDQYGRPLNPF